MDIQVTKLTADMADEYIDFFDNRAFSDGSPEKGCYCVWHHWTDEKERERSMLPESERPFSKRNYARQLILNGRLNGFAAVYDGKIAGFCNADNKDSYFRLSCENAPDTWEGIGGQKKVLAVVCFIVAPDMRRHGIAKALLRAACSFAAENGYDCIEGYPAGGEFKASNCGGTDSMYTECGFGITEVSQRLIARKYFR